MSLRLYGLVSLVALLGTFAAGCGTDSIVKNVAVRSYQQDNDAYGEVKATLNIGATSLPSFELPIADPRNPNVVYGKLGMTSGFGGLADIIVDVNLTEVAKVPGGNGTLPNGTPLPIAGLDPSKVVTLPVGHTSARIYVAFDNNLAIIGTAIPVREFDKMGQYGGGLNLFTGFNFPGGVRGIGGFFTSRTAGQNGFGIFVDGSSLLPKPVASNRMALAVRSQSTPVSFVEQRPGKSKEENIKKVLYKLSTQRARLNVD